MKMLLNAALVCLLSGLSSTLPLSASAQTQNNGSLLLSRQEVREQQKQNAQTRLDTAKTEDRNMFIILKDKVQLQHHKNMQRFENRNTKPSAK